MDALRLCMLSVIFDIAREVKSLDERLIRRGA